MLDDLQFWPTPPSLAVKAWAKFKDRNFIRVLEPSAGNGALVEAAPGISYNRHNAIPIDCIEIDLSHHPVLRSKPGCQVVGVDFMNYASAARYSHIIANPPFSVGARHVLRMWDLLLDGEIVAIINAETLRNSCTQERQKLARLVAEHGEVEFLTDTFNGDDAERKTDVEVALVWLRKQSDMNSEIVGDLIGEMRQDKMSAAGLAADFHDQQQLSLPRSFIENSVLTFNAAVEATRQSVLSEARARYYANLLGETLEHKLSDVSSSKDSSRAWVLAQINERYDDLKNRAWTGIIHSTDVLSKLSKSVQRRVEAEFETIRQLEFTESNIRAFLLGLAERQGEIQLDMCLEVFDLISRYHSDNAHGFAGWKSNDRHRTMGMKIKATRWILPGYQTDSWRSSLSWDAERTLADIDRVFAMLDGKTEPTYGLRHAFRDRFTDLRSGQRVTTDYMDIRYYSGIGTIHFFPHGTKLIDRLNRLVGVHRKWLPPEGEKVNEAFWLQYDQAAKFDRELRSEVAKQRTSRWNDPFWKAQRGDQQERDAANDTLVTCMLAVLSRHGIDPDALIEDHTPVQRPLLLAA